MVGVFQSQPQMGKAYLPYRWVVLQAVCTPDPIPALHGYLESFRTARARHSLPKFRLLNLELSTVYVAPHARWWPVHVACWCSGGTPLPLGLGVFPPPWQKEKCSARAWSLSALWAEPTIAEENMWTGINEAAPETYCFILERWIHI